MTGKFERSKHGSKERVKYALWFDLENTGAETIDDGAILEVGAILTRLDDFDRVLGRFETVVLCPEWREKTGPFVTDMHERSGLAKELDSGTGMSLVTMETYLMGFIACKCDFEYDVLLAGGSIHTDLAWINAYMPGLANMLHYRIIDVSSVKRIFEGILPSAHNKRKHRAFDDAYASLEEARCFRSIREKL